MPTKDQDAPRRSLFGAPRAVVEAALPDRETVSCPLCDREPTPFAVDFQGLCLARCPGCGLECHSPRPVFAQLAAAVYEREYHAPHEATADPSRRAHFTRQAARLEQSVPGDHRMLLDVGCGAGAFLRFARERGWQVSGTDVVLSPGASSSGAHVWVGRLREIDFGGLRFDVVRFNHVLEHTENPLTELRCARELTRPGGIVLIGVPNVAGFSLRVKSWQSRLHLKAHRWRHYAAVHHLWFFTPRTLQRLAGAAGFDLVHWETPVLARSGRPSLGTAAYRTVLESLRAGGILDFYGRRV